jgi:uracil-DNA glycosylase family 4
MSHISHKKVNHVGPENADIFILGEAPGEDDNLQGIPFVGRTGEFLDHLLSLVGISRAHCRIGNVCNYQPKGNDFKLLHGSQQLLEGKSELISYLSAHSPKIIIAMGNEALKFLTGCDGITKWRGSVLRHNKSYVIPTIHPAMAFRDGQVPPIIEFDLRKAKRVLEDGYTNPVHYFDEDYGLSEIHALCNKVATKEFITADIESIRGTTHILCIGFGLSSRDAVCIRNRYPISQGADPEFVVAVQSVLDAANSITFHNGLFDVEVLRLNGITVPEDKYDFDTMYAQRVIAPELPIGLDFCGSVYTDEPYYKDDGKDSSPNFRQTLWDYNCKDCIVTFETREKQEEILDKNPLMRNTFNYQMSIIPVALHLQESGMEPDVERITFIRDSITAKLDTARGYLYAINGEPFNTASPKQVIEFLHKKLNLPTRSNRENKVTTNEDALVSLISYSQKEMDNRKTDKSKQDWLFKLSALKLLLLVRGYEKLISSYLNIKLSPDGRIRSSYKVSGTETGRWSASNYVDGSGFNAQTLPREEIEI